PTLSIFTSAATTGTPLTLRTPRSSSAPVSWCSNFFATGGILLTSEHPDATGPLTHRVTDGLLVRRACCGRRVARPVVCPPTSRKARAQSRRRVESRYLYGARRADCGKSLAGAFRVGLLQGEPARNFQHDGNPIGRYVLWWCGRRDGHDHYLHVRKKDSNPAASRHVCLRSPARPLDWPAGLPPCRLLLWQAYVGALGDHV